MSLDFVITKEKLKERYPEIFRILNFYYSFPGLDSTVGLAEKSDSKRLSQLIEEHIVKRENYHREWELGFCKNLSEKLNRKVVPSTLGFAPCRSAYILLEENKKTHEKQTLHLHVSLIENYYCLEIVETKPYISKKQHFFKNGLLAGIKSITVSPYGKYSNQMTFVDNFIREYFDSAIFLPFAFELLKLEKFKVPHSNEVPASIRSAFFETKTKFVEHINICGNIYHNFN